MPTKILFVTFPHDVFTLHYSCCLPLLNACVDTKNLALWELSLKMKDCQTSEERYLKLYNKAQTLYVLQTVLYTLCVSVTTNTAAASVIYNMCKVKT